MDDLTHILFRLGEQDPSPYQPGIPPLIQSTNFYYDSVEDMSEALAKEDEIPFYTRGFNPTTNILQKKLAALEKTEDCLAFASGSAAVTAAVLVHLKQGDHMVSVDKPYSWSGKLFKNFLNRFGVKVTMVDGRDPRNFEKALRENTKVIFLESPNSWTFELQDIQKVAQIAHMHGIVSVIDNSYATPLGTQPATLGIDTIVHSATKYIGGHGDAVAGILCSDRKTIQKIFKSEFMTLGGVISPFNAWLLLRGLRTLPLRLERSSNTTKKVVDYLEQHPKIDRIYYPFSPSHPQHKLAKKQMKYGTGQFTLTLNTDQRSQVETFCNSLKAFRLACSWGSFESLIFPAITLENSQNYSIGQLPINMVRCYVGLDEPETLIKDLEQGLKNI